MRVFEAFRGETLQVDILPAMFDNYMYGIRWDGGAAIIDPSEGELVLQWVREQNLDLKYILNTHHHGDHVFGNIETHEATGAEIVGPDDARIPGLGKAVGEGDTLRLGSVDVQVLATPGHGSRDLSFHIPSQQTVSQAMVFTGDALFCGGCGRIMDGSMEQLFESLQKLAGLDDDTLVLCGHEYTLDNMAYAEHAFPGSEAIAVRAAAEKEKRDANLPTVPSTIRLEKDTNPFLLAKDLAEFTRLRKQKNHFG